MSLRKEIVLDRYDVSSLMAKKMTFEELAKVVEEEYSPVLGKMVAYGNDEVKYEKGKYFYYYKFESGYRVRINLY